LFYMAIDPISFNGILSDTYLNFGATLASFEFDMQVTAKGYMPATFDWDGNTEIPCTASQAEDGAELDVAGWKRMRKVKISLNISELPDATDLPAYNDTFVLRLSDGGPETKYRIFKTRNSGDVRLEIEGVDSNHPLP
jgi:hypothetical protein